ncbi:MAG: UDP-galactopyranose mutase [Rhizomicrobium sp.]
MKPDVLIVGAGFAGSVCAERLAAHGRRVLLIDRRDHVGGNAHDRSDAHGIRIHPYGPHIFHTNSDRIVRYLSQFTAWRPYEHRVRASVNGVLYPFPINRTTINRLYGLNLSEDETRAWFERVKLPRERIVTSEDLVLSSVGSDLCEKFFRFYTRKQWGRDLSELSAGVAARIPVRTDDDDRYFTDTFQSTPKDGYTALFQRMLDHPLIEIRTATDFADVKQHGDYRHVVYTGPIDAFFDHSFGALPYRSLRFEHEHLPGVDRYQEVGTVNYPNDHAFTRVTEFKHLTGQTHAGTSIVREYPQSAGEPYYPVPNPDNEALYKKYEALAAQTPNVTFVGRLAQYRYYNMDQVVGAALTAAERIVGVNS